MNRSIKSLILAAGVVAAALTVTVAPAQADPNGPGVIQVGPIVDPEPQPEPKPQVDGPDQIANPPHCTHGCGGPEAPKAPKAPEDETGPAPTADPANEAPLDQGCFTGCDLPEEPLPTPAAQPTVEAAPVAVLLDSDKPSAGDQLDRGVDVPPPAVDQGDLNLLWIVVAAGAGMGALLLLAIARRRRQQAHEA